MVKRHQLISSVCISKNGSMIWNHTDASTLTMKQLNLDEIKSYLKKIDDKNYMLMEFIKSKQMEDLCFQKSKEMKIQLWASCKKNKGVFK